VRRMVPECPEIHPAEAWRAGAAHVEGAVKVDRQHVRPVGKAHAVEDAVAQDAGIVDQTVDPAEGGERGGDDLVGVLRLGDRERRGDRLAAGALDLVDHRLRRSGVGAGALEARTDVADDDARPFLRQQERNGAADAAAGAGDDCDLAGDDAWHGAPLIDQTTDDRRWMKMPYLSSVVCRLSSVVRYPQISSATSTMRASFAHCSSSVSRLPSSVEAKPH